MSALFRCPPEVLMRSAIRTNFNGNKGAIKASVLCQRQGMNIGLSWSGAALAMLNSKGKVSSKRQSQKLTIPGRKPHPCLQINIVAANGGAMPARRMTQKAAVCTELGKPLTIQQIPIKDLGSGQVRVAIHACGINFSDLLMVKGLYQQKPPLPFVPGAEVAGEVIEVSEGVRTVAQGDRVVAMAPLGGFAEQCIVDEETVWRIPGCMSYEEGAALPISYGTAWLGLTRRTNTKAGETVLVTAAAGAVGLATVDLATNVIGAKVIGAAGGPDKCQIVSDKGAIGTIDYKEQSIREKVKELTGGRGADVICETVGGDVFKECLRSIAWEGRLLIIGFAGGDIPKIPANILLVKNISTVGLFWGNYRFNDSDIFRQSVQDVLKFYQEGNIKPHVCRTFTLEQANEAFMFIHKRKSTGKVVLKIQ